MIDLPVIRVSICMLHVIKAEFRIPANALGFFEVESKQRMSHARIVIKSRQTRLAEILMECRMTAFT